MTISSIVLFLLMTGSALACEPQQLTDTPCPDEPPGLTCQCWGNSVSQATVTGQNFPYVSEDWNSVRIGCKAFCAGPGTGQWPQPSLDILNDYAIPHVRKKRDMHCFEVDCRETGKMVPVKVPCTHSPDVMCFEQWVDVPEQKCKKFCTRGRLHE